MQNMRKLKRRRFIAMLAVAWLRCGPADSFIEESPPAALKFKFFTVFPRVSSEITQLDFKWSSLH